MIELVQDLGRLKVLYQFELINNFYKTYLFCIFLDKNYTRRMLGSDTDFCSLTRSEGRGS